MGTKVINFFAGPGAGKSTAATGVFSHLKQKGILCEYVSEYAKDLVWEGTDVLLQNQIHVFAEQFRRQWRLMGKVDYVITDSPLLLSAVYFNRWRQETETWLTESFCNLTEDYFIEAFNQFDNLNWFIRRDKPYVPKGRIQTEKEAHEVDGEVANTLKDYVIPYYTTTSNRAIDDVVNEILSLEYDKLP